MGIRVLHNGEWLSYYDPDAYEGRGHYETTHDARYALPFETAADAIACYTATSTRRPVRRDGKPNKPLTALSVAVEALP